MSCDHGSYASKISPSKKTLISRNITGVRVGMGGDLSSPVKGPQRQTSLVRNFMGLLAVIMIGNGSLNYTSLHSDLQAHILVAPKPASLGFPSCLYQSDHGHMIMMTLGFGY